MWYYFFGQVRDYLLIIEGDGLEGNIGDFINFVFINFVEMNKFWVCL